MDRVTLSSRIQPPMRPRRVNQPQSSDFSSLIGTSAKALGGKLLSKLADIIMLSHASKMIDKNAPSLDVERLARAITPQRQFPPTYSRQLAETQKSPPTQAAPSLPAPYASKNRDITRQEVDRLVDKAAAEHKLNPSLVRAVVTAESDYDNSCVSSAGAMGLMQLMPETAKDLGVTDPFDPAQNVDGGARYLAQMLKRFGGDEKKALAAYNWGPSNVETKTKMPGETRNYLVKVARFRSLYEKGFSTKA